MDMEDKTVLLDDGAFLNFMLEIEKEAIARAEKELENEKLSNQGKQ